MDRDRYDTAYFKEQEQNAQTILENIQQYKSEQETLRGEAKKLSLTELTDKIYNSLSLLTAKANEQERVIIEKISQSTKFYGRQLKESLYIIDSLVKLQLSQTKVSQQELGTLRIAVLEKTLIDFKEHKKEKDYLIKTAEKQEKISIVSSLTAIIIIGGLIIWGVWWWLCR